MITLVAGTRPNFVKVAPIWRALRARNVVVRLLHTGQHTGEAMSDVFFRDLGLPATDVKLETAGGSQAAQTAAILVGVEADLVAHRPSALVVVGDVTSTLAAALAAAKLCIPIVHVEAGLRSGDWTMPEEINRVVTDRVSDLLLTSSVDDAANLRAEGIPAERISHVGNVMIDSLRHAVEHPTDIVSRLGLARGGYAVVTLHRPANVDTAGTMIATLEALTAISSRTAAVFPAHPRTVTNAEAFGLGGRFRQLPGLCVVEPLGYSDFITLLSESRFAATDSGGIQEETTVLGIPCLTLREGTERPVTVSEGTNTIVGNDVARLSHEISEILAGRGKRGRIPDGWDGHAGERIAVAIRRFLDGAPPPRSGRPVA
ncbi:MAG: UDP-N-acetylglucosamine 2-epimerase (non-hydrolyzing) [Deltaproteobacteria bacterium]